MSPVDLLLIEDDNGIALALTQALREYRIDRAVTGSSGLAKASSKSHAVIILDLNLPDIHGLEVCKQLRSQNRTTPIIVVSCEAKVLSKISVLDAGADDYLTKPFSLGELKVRLRALCRRSNDLHLTGAAIQIDELLLNREAFSVQRNGQSIKLRRKEFALLECLMQRAGTVVTRQILCEHAWRGQETPWFSTVDVHIKYLRDKVDRPFDRRLITTVHGVGYKLEAGATASSTAKSALAMANATGEER